MGPLGHGEDHQEFLHQAGMCSSQWIWNHQAVVCSNVVLPHWAGMTSTDPPCTLCPDRSVKLLEDHAPFPDLSPCSDLLSLTPGLGNAVEVSCRQASVLTGSWQLEVRAGCCQLHLISAQTHFPQGLFWELRSPLPALGCWIDVNSQAHLCCLPNWEGGWLLILRL